MQNIHLYMFRPPVWSLELYVTQQLVSRKQRKCHFPIVFLLLKPSSPGRSASQQFFEPAIPKLSHVLSLLLPQPALSILAIKSDQQADRQWFTSEQLASQAALLGKMPLLYLSFLSQFRKPGLWSLNTSAERSQRREWSVLDTVL